MIPPAVDPPAPIVITAPSLPAPRSDRTLGVVEFERADLLASPSTQIDEIVTAVPGAQLFRRSDSRSSHPTSQGVTMRALGGNASSRALLVLDGVPQSDPFGGWIVWPAIDPFALQSVSVVRGGGSVTHGPGALAGVIRMESLAVVEPAGELAVGSRNSLDGHVAADTSVGNATVGVSARHERGDGFVPITVGTRGPADRQAPYRQTSGRLTAAAPLATDMQAQLAGSAFRDSRDRGLDFTDNRTDGADLSLRIVGSGALPFSLLAYGQWRKFMSSFASTDEDRTEATQVALQHSVPSSGVGGSAEIRPSLSPGSELRLGLDARAVEGESSERYFFVDGAPTRARSAGGTSATLGAFAEYSVERDPLVLTAAARIDHWRIGEGDLREWQLADGTILRDEESPSRSGWLPTGRAGVAANLGQGWQVRGAAYFGWRLPTLNELFRPFRVGSDATAANASLDPERLKGIEAGIEYRRPGLSAGVTVFDNRLSDAIANVTLAQGPGNFPGVGFVGAGGLYQQRRNLDAVHVRGVEMNASLENGPWGLDAGASLARARVDAENEAMALDGLRPAQTPAVAWTATARWDRDGRAAALTVRHSGPQFEDDLNSQKLPAATVFGAYAAMPLSDRIQLFARAENLTNETRIARIEADGTIERGTPRTLWLGVRLTP